MDKKRIIIACAACALLLGGALAESAETPAPVETTAEPASVKGSQTISWPQEYLIAYEYQLPDGRVGQITQGRDTQGNVYFQSDGEETLFAADGAHYLIYRANEAGELVRQPDMYSETYVQEQVSALVEYASKASQWYLDGAVYAGAGEVALLALYLRTRFSQLHADLYHGRGRCQRPVPGVAHAKQHQRPRNLRRRGRLYLHGL